MDEHKILTPEEKIEFESRITKLKRGMAEEGIDLLLLHSPTRGHARYASNHPTPFPWTHYCHTVPGSFMSTDSTIVILPSEGEPILIISPYLPAFLLADEFAWIRDIRRATNLAEEVIDAIIKAGLKRDNIGIAGDEIPQFVYRGLVDGLSASNIIFVTEMVEKIRTVKSEMEIQSLREAARLGDEVWETIKRTARPGKKLYEITGECEYTVKKQGSDKFAIFLSSGKMATRGLGIPPIDTVIQENDILITEISPKSNGYFTQICRVAVFGKPSQLQKDIFNATLRAKDAAIEKAGPGVTVHEMAEAGYKEIEEAGFSKYVAMRIGHGLGLDMTEIPYGIKRGDHMKFQPGNTMVVHPALHAENLAGAMCGEHILITETGSERLSVSKDEMIQLS